MTRPAAVRRTLIAAVVLSAGLAHAAPATKPADAVPPMAQRMMDRAEKLNLTLEQKEQFKQLREQAAQTAQEMAKDLKDLPPAERRERLRDALDLREKVKAILTPEQMQQLQATADDNRNPGRKPLKDLKADGKAAKKNGTTTNPAEADGPMVARLRTALGTLGLTPEQKEQTDALLADANTQAAKIRQDAAGDRDAAREKAKELAQSLRPKLAAVLTAEQKEKLAEQMPGLRAGPAGAKGENRRQNRRDKIDGKKADDAPPATQPAAAGAPAAKAPAVGDDAPTFALRRLGSGAEVTNKSFAGKPLVLAFGSLTSPAFRDRIGRLETLRNQYRGRAAVLVVYTREEHPADGWQVERNRDEKIEVNQPTTLDERVALAGQLKERTKTTLDIAVDDTSDAVATAYGSRPQGAAVISRYGKIVGTQTFCDPSGLGRMIDEAIAAKE